MQQSRRKTAAIVTAVTLAVAILLTGTFAWRSISQQAKNEIIRAVNPGGRLHDDFNGENKDIYVENFFTTNEGGQPIFARVRLDEYMETGKGSGLNQEATTRTPVSLITGAKINSPSTWQPYDLTKTTEAQNKIRKYWSLTMGEGEQIAFIPTFNKNKDSLSADINGTYGTYDKVADKYDETRTPFDDYVKYDITSKEEDYEYMDADEDIDDEYITAPTAGAVPGGGGVENDDYKRSPDTVVHKAKLTGVTQKVMKMSDWEAAGSPVGPYWVFDDSADGGCWFYWAQPIMPGESTGLLLDEIKYIYEDDAEGDESYYAINVVGQFATAGEWGNKDAPAGDDQEYQLGFYSSEFSDNAKALLDKAAGIDETVVIKETDGKTTVAPGGSLEFTATVKDKDADPAPAQDVTWSVVVDLTKDTTAVKSGTTISADGKLTVDPAEPERTLIVRATSKTANKAMADYVIKVEKATATTP